MTVYYFKLHNKWTLGRLAGQNFSLFEIIKIGDKVTILPKNGHHGVQMLENILFGGADELM